MSVFCHDLPEGEGGKHIRIVDLFRLNCAASQKTVIVAAERI